MAEGNVSYARVTRSIRGVDSREAAMITRFFAVKLDGMKYSSLYDLLYCIHSNLRLANAQALLSKPNQSGMMRELQRSGACLATLSTELPNRFSATT